MIVFNSHRLSKIIGKTVFLLKTCTAYTIYNYFYSLTLNLIKLNIFQLNISQRRSSEKAMSNLVTKSITENKPHLICETQLRFYCPGKISFIRTSLAQKSRIQIICFVIKKSKSTSQKRNKNFFKIGTSDMAMSQKHTRKYIQMKKIESTRQSQSTYLDLWMTSC